MTAVPPTMPPEPPPPRPKRTTPLTDTDRDNIAEARRIGRLLRASSGDRDKLAGWLLAELADLAERLGGGNG